jgi:protein AroM
MRDGSEVFLNRHGIVEAMQELVASIDADGADAIVVLCGHDWSKVRTRALLVNPGVVFPSIVSALARGRKLGIIKPSASQEREAEAQMCDWGVEACVATSASPYLGEACLEAAAAAAEQLRREQVELVWMSCVGMDEAMRHAVLEVVQRPVLLACSLLARVIAETVAPLARFGPSALRTSRSCKGQDVSAHGREGRRWRGRRRDRRR